MPDYLELLPAVDIAGGQAVQLVQGVAGSEKRFGDPVEAALRWQDAGAEWLHLVDLDAAFGRGHNRELQAKIVGVLDIKVEMSGGIRDDESLAAAMATGLPARQHRHRRAGAAGVVRRRDRGVRRPGRRRPRRPGPDAGRARLDPGRRRPLRRARAARLRGLRPLRGHRREQGRHAPGPEPAAAARRLRATDRPVVASGGITELEDLRALQGLVGANSGGGVEGAIIGTALYEGRFTLEDGPGPDPPGIRTLGMSLAVRVIPCLDVDAGRVVKGINFRSCATRVTRSSWPGRTTPRAPTS
jgi:phosphoribosylanthranilate isomerase